jgi:SAM-dependent methyltransferase
VKKNPDTIFGKEYYEACYRDYARQNPPGKLAFYKSIVESIAAGGPGFRLLDVGCAFGLFLSCVNPAWKRYGADVSEFAIRQAASRCPEARFFAANVAALPCKQSFDVIVAFDILEHVRDMDSAAIAIKSRLCAMGCFIFVVPVYDGPTGPLIKLLDHDATHIHRMPRTWWLQWAARHFTLCQWWGMYRYLLPGNIYVHLPTKTFRNFTPAIAVAVKNK